MYLSFIYLALSFLIYLALENIHESLETVILFDTKTIRNISAYLQHLQCIVHPFPCCLPARFSFTISSRTIAMRIDTYVYTHLPFARSTSGTGFAIRVNS